jgi:hypothetical protein
MSDGVVLLPDMRLALEGAERRVSVCLKRGSTWYGSKVSDGTMTLADCPR